jgi:outer membrane lipoprotein-sorting protein
MIDDLKRAGSGSTGRGVLLLLLVIFGWNGSAHAQQLGVEEILKKCDVAEGYEGAFAQMEQIITTTGGQKRTLVIRSWAVDSGDRQLAEYLAPADIKGQKILMTDDGDNIWMFNPETRRTRKLGSHMKKKKVMGSDFTYEDQSGGKVSEKYTGILLREEEEGAIQCFVTELKPTPKGPSYARIIAWIGKSDFLIRRIDYFREDEPDPFKRLTAADIRKVGDRDVAFRLTMSNLEDGTETVNIINEIEFGVKIPGSLFEARNLER